MHFDTGKFGAVVIVLALIGTIVLGYCTDVTKVEGVRTDYDYITDITGLFETEQVPEYIEYNPNSNYVGYTGPVIYKTSNQPNNYRYVVNEGTSSTLQGVTVNRNSNYGAPYNYDDGYVYSFPCYYSGSTYDMGGPAYVGPQKMYNLTSNSDNTTDLSKILASLVPSIETYGTVEISVNQNSTWPCFMYPYSAIEKISNVQAWVILTDANVITRITVNPVTLVATAYAGSSISFSCPANQFFVQEGYTTIKDGTGASMSATLTPTVTTPPTYGYADPTGGVRLAGGYDTVVWNNGYSVEEVTIYLGQYEYPRQSAVNILFYPTGNSFNQNLWVSFSNVLEIRVYDHQVDGVSTYTFGKWQGVEITYNRSTGIITATPTGTISDYTVGSSVKGTETQITRGWSGSETAPTDSSITFRTGSNVPSPYIGVYRTIVDLNSYNVVMNNPTINIKDYWPNLDDYRLNFYSFALVGESVTINGVQYPIGEGQTITVTESVAEGETAETYTQVLSNIYVSTDTVDGVRHTYLTFVDDRLTVDLGETITEVVSFSGLWYFTTALYDAETVTYSEYEWNLDGEFGLSYDVVFLIFIGLCIVGIVLGRTFLPDSMHFLDYVLIIGAIVIAFACVEVFL